MRSAILLLICLPLAACDPMFFGVVHGEVRGEAGDPVPPGTTLRFYASEAPGTATNRLPFDSATTLAGGVYEKELMWFVHRPRTLGITALGTAVTVPVRAGLDRDRAPRTRVDLTLGAGPAASAAHP